MLDPLDPSLSFRSRIRYFDTRCQLWVQRAFASAIARVRVRACGRAITSRVVGHHVTSQQPLSRLAALIEIDLYFCESRISIIRTFDLVASIFFIGRERWGESFATLSARKSQKGISRDGSLPFFLERSRFREFREFGNARLPNGSLPSKLKLDRSSLSQSRAPRGRRNSSPRERIDTRRLLS